MNRKTGAYIILALIIVSISAFVYFHSYSLAMDTIIQNSLKLNSIHSLILGSHNSNKMIPTLEIEKEWKNCDLEVSESRKIECKREKFMNHTVICVLIDWNNIGDFKEVKKKLLPSIQYLKPMEFIFFSDREPNETIKADIKKASHHKFQFVKIEFNFPLGFDHVHTKSPNHKRSKWGYMHMIRFWFKTLWLEPALKPYKYVLRFDTDSCLVGKNFSFPTDDTLVYQWVNFRYEVLFITDLKSTILNYVKTKNIDVKNKKMFSYYKKANVPMYYNNMEIVSIEFMNRPEVRDFVNAIDASHGQYKYRWGDAPLRYATLALFAEEKSVQPLSVSWNNGYRHPC